MDRLATSPKGAAVRVRWDELLLLNNALNEVCHGVGFDDGEFQTRLGLERTDAQDLLGQLSLLLNEAPRT